MAEKIEALLNAAIKAANRLPTDSPDREVLEARVSALEARYEAILWGSQ